MARICIYNQKPFDKVKILSALTLNYTLGIFINIQLKKYKLQYQAYENTNFVDLMFLRK